MGELDAASHDGGLIFETYWKTSVHRTRRPLLRSSGCTWITRSGRFGCPWTVGTGPLRAAGSRPPGPEMPLLWVHATTAAQLDVRMHSADAGLSPPG